jgi:aspartyl-tRNA(Asn)/glutamyl-tRNA(Gln) amidotransferase subunit A
MTMQADEICWMTAAALADRIRCGEISATDAVRAVLDRINRVDPQLGAYVTVVRGAALAEAEEADRRHARGETLGALHGVPVSIKDIIYTKGIRTTAGSFLYEHFVPDTDAIVVERLKQAGAIVIGKTSTPEFCHKTVTDSPLLGTTRNPWDLTRTTAGSSGGSAAAVAAGLGPLSIGTDGGGSIRLPAALCGIVGFKPSVGRVPQFPGFAGWDFLGHTGPLARDVADVQLAMWVIAGADVRDPTSLRAPTVASGRRDTRELRIAVVSSLNHLEPENDVAAGLQRAADAVRQMGATVRAERVSWTDPDLRFRVIVASELAAALGHHLSNSAPHLDPTLVKMLEFGAVQRATDLAQALAWRGDFSRRVLTWFEKYDVLLVPTAPVTAFPLGIIGPTTIAGRKTSPYDWFAWTWPFNLTGQPVLSLPVWTESALPVGIQIVGRLGADDLVLDFAARLERELGAPALSRRPSLRDKAA